MPTGMPIDDGEQERREDAVHAPEEMDPQRVVVEVARHRLLEGKPDGLGLGQEQRLDPGELGGNPPQRQQRRDAEDAQAGRRALAQHAVAAGFLPALGGARRVAHCFVLIAHAGASRPRMSASTCSRTAMKSGSDLMARASRAGDVAAAEIEVVGLLDLARTRRHDDEAGGEEDRLLDRVGDEEDQVARAVPHVEDQLLQLLAGQRVERAQRLVHQQHFRTAGERAGDADALLHAAGQLVDHLGLEAGQSDQLQLLAGNLRAAPLG